MLQLDNDRFQGFEELEEQLADSSTAIDEHAQHVGICQDINTRISRTSEAKVLSKVRARAVQTNFKDIRLPLQFTPFALPPFCWLSLLKFLVTSVQQQGCGCTAVVAKS